MGQCFHPDCNHTSQSHCCRFFTFPDKKKQKALLDKWILLVRRGDREPNKHSRICSCHFKDGQKENMPTINDRNKHKLFNNLDLHLAQLFACSVATVANIVLTFVHVLHYLLFKHIMTSIPSREKNKMCSPSSFAEYTSCKVVIDCTDIEIAAPKLMSQQNATYSTYRGFNSFKVIIGVAPNGVITYVSDLFPGSVSDKVMVKESGLCKHLCAGDLILADKGFLISDIVPRGVSVNIPPFLNNGKFTESEARATKSIARCRIHVERANARLKSFRILTFIPAFLRCHADKLVQLCSALVNLQFPLIKDGCEDFEFD